MADEPIQLTDDEAKKVVIPEEEAEQPETPAEEPAPEEPEEVVAPEEPTEEAPQEEDKPTVPEEQPPSNRLLTRAQKLLEKYGPPEPRTSQPTQPERPERLDYQTALDADPEVIKKLEDDRQREGDSRYNEGLRRAEAIEFRNNIRFDLPLVTEKLAKLDPRDADALDKEYLYTVGFDPKTGYVQNMNIGYAEFIEARLEMSQRLADSMNAETVKNVAKQAANTGLRPDGSSAKKLNLNQAPENMTIEELYAKIGQAPPKK